MIVEHLSDAPEVSIVHRSVTALARLEGRRFLRSPAYWVGAALTIATWVTADLDTERWVGSQYGDLLAIDPFTMYIGAFVAGASVGMRDRLGEASPVTDATPLGAGDRVLARLLGGLTLVVLAVAQMVGLYIYVAQSGGIAVGGRYLRPGLADLAVVPVVVGLAVATGIALGQLVRWRFVVVLGGSFVIALTTVTAWMFGSSIDLLPAVVANPQTIRLDAGQRLATIPPDVILVAPDGAGGGWGRASFEPAAVSWHLVYVVGLTALVWALARRVHGPSRIGRSLVLSGAALTIIGGTLQYLVRTGTFV